MTKTMAVKLEGRKKPYHPKDSDKVECHIHGVMTTWGCLTDIAKLCFSEGLDVSEEFTCLLER